jgi:hypothetical protein
MFFEFTETHLWLLIAYVVGTLFGILKASRNVNAGTSIIIEATMDRLIKDGYIKSRLDKDGQVEILKYWEEE